VLFCAEFFRDDIVRVGFLYSNGSENFEINGRHATLHTWTDLTCFYEDPEFCLLMSNENSVFAETSNEFFSTPLSTNPPQSCDFDWCQEEGYESEIHSADQDGNGAIDLSELLRVIQFYNSSGYHCDASTEDGYAPGPGDPGCVPHASDYNAQDWIVNLSELLRLIQFYNTGGYTPCEGGEDGYCPGAI
jgi:hypothetical protein